MNKYFLTTSSFYSTFTKAMISSENYLNRQLKPLVFMKIGKIVFMYAAISFFLSLELKPLVIYEKTC